MIDAQRVVGAAGDIGFKRYSAVPCSYLTPLINYVIDSEDLQYVGAANEGDAVAIAAGATLGGERSIVMMQNSGLGNAVSPLTSLNYVFRIPVLLYITLRGQPGGHPDEPQHELMGAITTDLLDLMRVPWSYFPETEEGLQSALQEAVSYMDRERRPYALLLKRGTIEPWALESQPARKALIDATTAPSEAVCQRRDILAALQGLAGDRDVLIATTGYTGRELYSCSDKSNQLYMVGSMGCASSLGLGLALARPSHRVIVIDGDGAALMRLGAMSSIGFERPDNLVHVLLDNQVHESTGGQATVSQSIDFCAIAAACGYRVVERIADPEALTSAIDANSGNLAFYHVPIKRGVSEDLARPAIRPAEVAARLEKFLRGG